MRGVPERKSRRTPSAARRAAAVLGLMLAGAFGQHASAAELPVHGDMIGTIRTHVTTGDEILHDIARRNNLGFVELRAANPRVDPWLPGNGTKLTLPTAHLLPDAPRHGIVINLGDQRLYYFPNGPETVLSFPIGTPRAGKSTPIGTTRVVAKRPNPTWFPPPSIREAEPNLPASVPPGPDNPLGAYALYLGWPGYLVHGTNKPDGVGRRVSHGCIRLYPESIRTLFEKVPIGTPVVTIDQPVKVGMSGGALYLEVHPVGAEVDEVEANGHVENPAPLGVEAYVRAKAGKLIGEIDWQIVDRTARERRGVPVRITRDPADRIADASGASGGVRVN